MNKKIITLSVVLVLSILLINSVYSERILVRKTSYTVQDCKDKCGCNLAAMLCAADSSPANYPPRCVNGIYNTVLRCYYQCLLEPECFNDHPTIEGPKLVNTYCEKDGVGGKCALEHIWLAPSPGFLVCDTSDNVLTTEQACDDIDSHRHEYESCPMPDYCGGEINEEDVVLDCDPECRPDGTKVVPGETTGHCELNGIKVGTLQEIRQYLCYMTPDPENPDECTGSYGPRIAEYFKCLRGKTILGYNLDEESESMKRNIFTPEEQRLPVVEEICEWLRGTDSAQECLIPEGIDFSWVESESTVPCVYNETCVGEIDSSCPYLYSVTQDGLKLEEDIIVAQLFKFMEEPFYTKLNNYDPSIGKLVIYEHLEELSHINQIELIKVEHSDDSEALIDSAGNIHTIKNPEKVLCIDNLGNDCTSMIEKQDAKLSIGSRETEFGELDYEVIIDSESHGKEAWAQSNLGLSYMELELPETDAKTGKLVIAFSYSGKNDVYEEIYKKLAKVDKLLISLSLIDNPLIENLFKEKYKDYFYRRILIEYLDNGEWKNYPNKEDYNLHTLPYKKTIVPLDMNIIKDNKIRIIQRESFVYDYIAVDYSKNEIISKEKISLLNSNKLLEHDDKEILLQQDEFIELEFEKSYTKNAVSYFLKSVGFYQPGVKK